jgi:peptide/nickel transport system permease protein
MARFIVRRILRGVITIVIFQTLLFGLIQVLPYDFTTFLVLQPESRRLARSELGLNLPLWQQYFKWLGDFFRLDLGLSYIAWPTPVIEVLKGRVSRTLLLFLTASILAYIIGIWLGKLVAWRRGGWHEFSFTMIGVISYTSFAPFLAFAMINIFGYYLKWFPYQRLIDHNVWYLATVSPEWILTRLVISGAISMGLLFLLYWFSQRFNKKLTYWSIRIWGTLLIALGVWGYWKLSGQGWLAVSILDHLTLPLVSVVLLSFGETMLLMRTTMLETIGENYILLAKAKGLPSNIVRDRHAARNAFFPVLTRLVLNLPYVIIGSLAIELVFNWQAMGVVVFQAIEYQDIPLLMGILSLVGIMALTGHIVLDIIQIYLDPRLRYNEGS